MGSLNRVMLIGHLGRDPEIKALQGGTLVANFSIATSESWKDKAGEKQEKTEWHRIKAFGKLAELVEKYLGKGRQVYVEGRLETRTWDDKEGKKRSVTEINASSIVFLGGGERTERPVDRTSSADGDTGGGLEEDDIPF